MYIWYINNSIIDFTILTFRLKTWFIILIYITSVDWLPISFLLGHGEYVFLFLSFWFCDFMCVTTTINKQIMIMEYQNLNYPICVCICLIHCPMTTIIIIKTTTKQKHLYAYNNYKQTIVTKHNNKNNKTKGQVHNLWKYFWTTFN